jgi:ADP-heptose:LPS heptosyltransferase
MVCTPRAAGLFDFDGRVQHVHPLRHRHLPLWASAQKRAIVRASRRAPYDLLINLESGQQFESLVTTIDARHKVGWFFTDPRPEVGIHCVQMYLSVASPALGVAAREAAVPRVYGAPPDDVRRRFGLPKRYLVVSPGNSHRHQHRLNHRAWPREQWLQLLALIPPDLPVIVLGAPGDDPLAPVLPADQARVMNLAGRTSVAELTTIIALADALVVTDTGTAHIAAAVNTPVVCLVGPTNPAVTGPYRTSHNVVEVVAMGLACSPCHDTPVMRQCTANRCMQEITPHRVMQSLVRAGVLSAPVNAP